MHGQQNLTNLILQVIVTIHRLDEPGLESRKRQNISLLQEVQTDYGTYTVSYSTVSKVFSPEVMRPRRYTNHLHPVPRLSGATPILLPYAFIALPRTTLPFYFTRGF